MEITSRKNVSAHRGVYYNKRSQKWCAHIQHKGKHKHLGSYTNMMDAIKAREEAEKQLHALSDEKNINQKERGIKKKEDRFVVTIKYQRNHKYITTVNDLEVAKTIRNYAELVRDMGVFDEWFENFKKTMGKKLHGNHEDLSQYSTCDLSILTEMQRQILEYRLNGKKNAEIAEIMGISKKSFPSYITIIKQKLNGTYKERIKKTQERLNIVRIERGIKKQSNKYYVFITYFGKSKHIACVDDLESARKLRDDAENARNMDVFDEWFEKFIVPQRRTKSTAYT